MAKKVKNLEELFVDLLKDLYSAEKQLTKALPKMAKAAQSRELRSGFEQHLRQTEHQMQRIEQIFTEIEGAPGGKKCVGMEGLIEEGSEMMKEAGNGDAMDAGLIAAAQKVEHYEISAYGTARAWAKKLGYRQAAQLLGKTLEEEALTDEKLTQLAEAFINQEAEQH